MSQWIDNLVNHNQTASERKAKYQFARHHGISHSHARRMRDWRWSKIMRRLGIEN